MFILYHFIPQYFKFILNGKWYSTHINYRQFSHLEHPEAANIFQGCHGVICSPKAQGKRGTRGMNVKISEDIWRSFCHFLGSHGMSWDVMGCHGMSWDIYLQILQINFFGENLPLNFNPAISPRRRVDAPIVTRMQHWLAGPRIVAKRISKPIPTPNKVWPFGLGNQFFELCLPIQENIFKKKRKNHGGGS